jgi:hypothetical protein
VGVLVVVVVVPSGPMKRMRPLKRRGSRGEVPNHSCSSVREEVIEWSVSSANLRFSGVFQVPGWRGGEEDVSCLRVIGGVGTRGSGSVRTSWLVDGEGGGNSRTAESFAYKLETD